MTAGSITFTETIDWQPYYECQPTMELRLFTDAENKPPVLQQKFCLRNGFGINAKCWEEWRDVPLVVDPAKPAG